MKPRIVDDWRQGWRWLSVQLMAAALVLPDLLAYALDTWNLLPPDLKAALPPTWAQWLGKVLLVGGIAGRFIAQRRPDKEAS